MWNRTSVKRLFSVLTLLLLGMIGLSPGTSGAGEPTFQNDIGMEFVLIPAGSFMMGSPAGERRRNQDEVQHKAMISRPFYLQTTEVTVAQWQALMGKKFLRRSRESDQPAHKVSWFDCQRFIEKLNARGKEVYRLPTEAEWEYACRAGSSTSYAWGNDLACSQAMFCNNTKKWSDCIGYVRDKGLPLDEPAPVKSYPPNAWGIYDMHGNVWEWCADWYGAYKQTAVTDPKGPDSGEARIRRGGSFFGEGRLCRSANRNYAHPSDRYHTVGFRVVMERR